MQVQSNVKAGGYKWNHNEKLVVASKVKAGGQKWNHNESLRPSKELSC